MVQLRTMMLVVAMLVCVALVAEAVPWGNYYRTSSFVRPVVTYRSHGGFHGGFHHGGFRGYGNSGERFGGYGDNSGENYYW